MSTIIGLLIALAACSITGIQYYGWIRKEVEFNTWNLLDLLHHRENQIDRLSVPKIIEKTKSIPFAELEPEDRACLARTSGMFVLAGILAEQRRIDLRILLPIFSYSIQDNYKHLLKYREWRETLDGYPKQKAFDYFKELSEKARIFSDTGKIQRFRKIS